MPSRHPYVFRIRNTEFIIHTTGTVFSEMAQAPRRGGVGGSRERPDGVPQTSSMKRLDGDNDLMVLPSDRVRAILSYTFC